MGHLNGIFAGENAGSLIPAVKLRAAETLLIEQLSPICELTECLAEIRPENQQEDLSQFTFPCPELAVTETPAASHRRKAG